mmetsp:Transcript_33200/g.94407  ORF Transcript_33200/g.94407 Transcript_33200/m.94407 type:complete len:106 (-) Transcript_33200:66-383(-)
MGCTGSKNAQQRREAEAYAKRKKTGFKDPGLEQHRKACVNQKKRLRHIQDPDKKRNQKQQEIHTHQLKTGKGPSPAAAGGGGGGAGGGFNQAEIMAAKANLKHRH